MGAREAAVERSRYGNVSLAERPPRPVIESHTWDAEGRLLLEGSYQGPASVSLSLALRLLDSADSYLIGCSRDGTAFTATAGPPALPVVSTWTGAASAAVAGSAAISAAATTEPT